MVNEHKGHAVMVQVPMIGLKYVFWPLSFSQGISSLMNPPSLQIT